MNEDTRLPAPRTDGPLLDAALLNAPLLNVRDLSIAFGARTVVNRVSFSLRRGQTLALVGESGSGKSLTALSALRLLPPGAATQGEILLHGENMLTARQSVLERTRGGIAGMIFQEPMTSLNPLHRIGRQVVEAMVLHRRVPRGERRSQAAALLERCGLADAMERLDAFPHQLSGGQRQRVMIAMALANDPALLIADEPTTALDVTIQAQILALLAREKAARGLALLLISHDLGLVRRYADTVCVMRQGEIVESGPAADVFANPQHDYTKMLIDSEPKGLATPLAREAKTILQVENLSVHFPIRSGLLRKVTGQIKFEGHDISGLKGADLKSMRARAQIVFQDPYGSLSPRLTVAQIVAEGLTVHFPDLSAPERAARVAQVLHDVGLPPDAAERFPHEFSGGQRQRIAIARALLVEPRLLVLDEPTSALDRSVQAQIIALLRDLQRQRGLAYLFISHDLSVVRALAHRVMVMRDGRMVEDGSVNRIFNAPRKGYTQSLLAASYMLPADQQDNRPSGPISRP